MTAVTVTLIWIQEHVIPQWMFTDNDGLSQAAKTCSLRHKCFCWSAQIESDLCWELRCFSFSLSCFFFQSEKSECQSTLCWAPELENLWYHDNCLQWVVLSAVTFSISNSFLYVDWYVLFIYSVLYSSKHNIRAGMWRNTIQKQYLMAPLAQHLLWEPLLDDTEIMKLGTTAW